MIDYGTTQIVDFIIPNPPGSTDLECPSDNKNCYSEI